MAVKRMDNVGIVVDDLTATIDFFCELGLVLEGRTTVEGEWAGHAEGRVTELIRTAFTAGHPRIRHSQAEDTSVSTSMALMARYRQAIFFAVLLGVASVVQPQPHAQTPTDVTGEWEASYQTPLGPQELKVYLTQEGPRISGHTSSEYGESQVRGTINSQDIQFTFQSTDGGRAIDVRVTAKVEGERMRGTAKIGDRAEGAFTAERTAS